MLKKLCVLFVGLGFCLGTIGCAESKEAQMPKEKIAQPTEKPSAETQKISPPE
jgi:hypothetical protein